MSVSKAVKTSKRSDAGALAALSALTSEAHECLEASLRLEIEELRSQAYAIQRAIDNVPAGVCLFDGNGRLAFRNRAYSELYNLDPREAPLGSTHRRILERRAAVGDCPEGVDAYLERCARIDAEGTGQGWTTQMPDGRIIQVHHQPMPEGGWVCIHNDITEVQVGRAIASERLSLQHLIDLVPDYLWVKDAQSRFVIANKALAQIAGRKDADDMVGISDFDFHAPEAARRFRDDELGVLSTGHPMIDREEKVYDATGAVRWLASTKVPLRNDAEEIVGLVGVARDITARKQAQSLRDAEAEVLELIAIGARLEDALDRLCRIVEDQAPGSLCAILLVVADGRRFEVAACPSLPPTFRKAIDNILIDPTSGSASSAAVHQRRVLVENGSVDEFWRANPELAHADELGAVCSTPVLSGEGQTIGVVELYLKKNLVVEQANLRVIDSVVRLAGIAIERKLVADRIQHMAMHDTLTGLPNRALLRDRLTQAVALAEQGGCRGTVAYADLDNFKFVNDSLGHEAGDDLLKIVARRMSGCLTTRDTVGRMGGDEFVVLLVDHSADDRSSLETLQEIKAAVAAPIHLRGHSLRTTISIGAAEFPEHGGSVDALLAHADVAMYRAKAQGRDNIQIYAPSMTAETQQKLRLREEMQRALNQGDFFLHFQPQVDLRTGRVFAVEALLRLKHATEGLLSPQRFIPVAEETGLIVPIGEWTLNEACRQNRLWRSLGLPPITMCVNVSGRQFSDRKFPDFVAAALAAHDLPPESLELEVTESLIMQDLDLAIYIMKELNALGVQIAIDDFGTGYSSLSALTTFPVSRLKIDKSFIRNLASEKNDRTLAAAIISLGRKLNMRVIAEGVERRDQIAFLREHRCEEAQGYYFSRPVGKDEIGRILQAKSAFAWRREAMRKMQGGIAD